MCTVAHAWGGFVKTVPHAARYPENKTTLSNNPHLIMKTKHVLPVGILAIGTLLASIAQGRATAIVFQPGEFLVNKYNAGSIQRYSPDGTYLQTYQGAGNADVVAALTADGRLVVASSGGVARATVDIFAADGTRLTTFPLNSSGVVTDVDVFPDGTLAIIDGSNQKVEYWTQTGMFIRTVTSSLLAPTGSTIGSDGILYVGGSNSFNVVKFTSGGSVVGAFTTGVSGNLFRPDDIVMNPADGTLWVSGSGVLGGSDGLIHHMTTSGVEISSFVATGTQNPYAIALATDHNSLYVGDFGNPVVKHYGLAGNLLGSVNFNHSTPNRLIVVPVPEPSAFALLGLGTLLLAARRRRSGRQGRAESNAA